MQQYINLDCNVIVNNVYYEDFKTSSEDIKNTLFNAEALLDLRGNKETRRKKTNSR